MFSFNCSKRITWKGTSPSYKPAIFAGSQRRVSLSILNLSIQNTFQIQYLYFSRYRPNTIAGLCEATGFSPQEVSLTKLTIQLMLIIFKTSLQYFLFQWLIPNVTNTSTRLRGCTGVSRMNVLLVSIFCTFVDSKSLCSLFFYLFFLLTY